MQLTGLRAVYTAEVRKRDSYVYVRTIGLLFEMCARKTEGLSVRMRERHQAGMEPLGLRLGFDGFASPGLKEDIFWMRSPDARAADCHAATLSHAHGKPGLRCAGRRSSAGLSI
jgi:hypothetical protein